MLKQSGIWTALSFPRRLLPLSSITHNNSIHIPPSFIFSEGVFAGAIVDGEEAEVLVFKGFSSCLSYKTSANPSTSVIPARAVIKSIDRIKGPFNPSNIQYIEKGLTLEAFKTRLRSH
ncbi:uncharacterized protein Fot_15087 [Forsythia ovata]|uniref:DUF7734 domain-containing protein n=1 Tax=Forsythia ovata TaxID=205694 RepID=A0ABD1W882_9LAMI